MPVRRQLEATVCMCTSHENLQAKRTLANIATNENWWTYVDSPLVLFHNIAKGEELVPGSNPWECDGFHDGGWEGGKIHCGKHAMVSLPNSMFMLHHICDWNFELLHRNFNLRYRMLYVTMNPSLFQIIFFVTCTASTYMFDAFHVSCSGSLQRKIKQGQGMVHHFRDDVSTCSWLENLFWPMKHHRWTYWSLFRKSWRPCMSNLPKPHGYLVDFCKKKRRTNQHEYNIQ